MRTLERLLALIGALALVLLFVAVAGWRFVRSASVEGESANLHLDFGRSTPLAADQRAYIGLWEGDGALLRITGSGTVDYRSGDFSGEGFEILRSGQGELVAGFPLLWLARTLEIGEPVAGSKGDPGFVVDGVALERVAPPAGGELATLVGGTATALADTLRREDFGVLANEMFLGDKDVDEVEQDLRGGLSALVERYDDLGLGELRRASPRFASEPRIDEEGELVVDADYRLSRAVVDLSLTYRYEPPSWRLWRFDVKAGPR